MEVGTSFACDNDNDNVKYLNIVFSNATWKSAVSKYAAICSKNVNV